MKKVIMLMILLTVVYCTCGMSLAAEEADAAVDQNTEATDTTSYLNAPEHTESNYYTANDYYNMESEGGLHILSHYKTYQQSRDYTCGGAAALMILSYFGIDGYDELELCDLMGTDPETGTTVEGLRDCLENLGFQLDCHADTALRFDSVIECEEYLIEAIDSGAPVLVEWVDWYGHWQTIIGIDTCETGSFLDDVLILADSFDLTDHCQDGYYIVPLARFFCMWRESPFTGKEVPYEQPFIKVTGFGKGDN